MVPTFRGTAILAFVYVHSAVCMSQLLEELADNGIAMITEPNALNSLIEPPSVGRRVMEFVTGKSRVSDTIGAAAMSVIPWRKAVRLPIPLP